VLAKNFNVRRRRSEMSPARAVYIPAHLPGLSLKNRNKSMKARGHVPNTRFFASKMQPTKVTPAAVIKIVDRSNFPATDIAAAIVTVSPAACAERHWPPNEDEWQYFPEGQGPHDRVLPRADTLQPWTF